MRNTQKNTPPPLYQPSALLYMFQKYTISRLLLEIRETPRSSLDEFLLLTPLSREAITQVISVSPLIEMAV